MSEKTKVLVVDDSLFVRKMLSRTLERDPTIEITATAEDPYVARDRIMECEPDVITLDIEMPRMDGLTFLKHLRRERPIPTIVISSLTQKGSRCAMEALEIGAIDVIAKPGGSASVPFDYELLAEKIKAAAQAGRRQKFYNWKNIKTRSSTTPPFQNRPARPWGKRSMLLLGASTGGTEALKEVLTHLPSDIPGTCIVQHLPPVFTASFAQRLDSLCSFSVKEAEEGDVIRPGLALIAPGGYHMVVVERGLDMIVRLKQTPKVWHQRPAVDVLFHSAAEIRGLRAVASVLTGMGRDGAAGLLALKEKGAVTYAESETTCVVYGMPRACNEINAAQSMVPLHQMSKVIENSFEKHLLK